MFETAAAWMVVVLFGFGIWLIAGAVVGGRPTGS
jgi:hypothetical protein